GEDAAPDAQARPEVHLRIGAGHTSNLFLDDRELRSDIEMLGVGLVAGKASSRWRGVIATDLEFRRYDAEIIEDNDELLGSLDGRLEIELVPERFVWIFEQNSGQSRTNPLAPVGPDNRERTDVFSTGPRWAFPVGG